MPKSPVEQAYDEYEVANKFFIKSHLLAKHKQIQPNKEQLELVGNLISNIEKALKKISDKLVDEELATLPVQETPAPVTNEPTAEDQKAAEQPKIDESKEKYRHLKGVVRVGSIVKTLFLKFDRDIHLVILTSKAPTHNFIKRISDELDTELALISNEFEHANEVEMKPSEEKNSDDTESEFKPPKVIYHMDKSENLIKTEACVNIKCELPDSDFLAESADNYRIKISFTSMSLLPTAPLVDNTTTDAKVEEQTTDISMAKCKNALTEIKRVKWFNSRIKPIANAILILRIMRELCQRSPIWSVLNDWLLELIIDKVFLRNKFEDITLKLRAVFECISSGVLFMSALSIQHKPFALPAQKPIVAASGDTEMKNVSEPKTEPVETVTTSPKKSENNEITLGFCDPCAEVRSEANVFETHLTVQQREELFASAQNLLRLLSFRKAHEVLAIDLIKISANHNKNRFNNENRLKRNANRNNAKNTKPQQQQTDSKPSESTTSQQQKPTEATAAAAKIEIVSMETTTSAPL